MLVEASLSVHLPDGRTLAVDDVGDPAGLPVLYLHGTPDCRLARHPHDGLATVSGVRLLAVDRPGLGASELDPAGTLGSFASDLGHLLDRLGIERAAVLGWSAGGLFGLAAAAGLGDRVLAVHLVGTVPPVEAYEDPHVLAALGPSRRVFAELARELDRSELAEEMAPYLVPDPLDAATALDHVLESAGEWGRAELAAVDGAAERLAESLLASVARGREGLVRELLAQLEPGLDLSLVTAPVRTTHGVEDTVSPPEVGRWLVAGLGAAEVEVVPDAGHHLLLPRWSEVLDAVRATAATRNAEDGDRG